MHARLIQSICWYIQNAGAAWVPSSMSSPLYVSHGVKVINHATNACIGYYTVSL